ncbi:MAG: Mor transcription activator family protein, partial [Shewanella sp.]
KQLRQEFGGREIYIKKRADSSQLIQSVLAQFTGNSTLACAKKMGVHRSTVYKYLKRQKARQLQPKTDDNRGKK